MRRTQPDACRLTRSLATQLFNSEFLLVGDPTDCKRGSAQTDQGCCDDIRQPLNTGLGLDGSRRAPPCTGTRAVSGHCLIQLGIRPSLTRRTTCRWLPPLSLQTVSVLSPTGKIESFLRPQIGLQSVCSSPRHDPVTGQRHCRHGSCQPCYFGLEVNGSGPSSCRKQCVSVAQLPNRVPAKDADQLDRLGAVGRDAHSNPLSPKWQSRIARHLLAPTVGTTGPLPKMRRWFPHPKNSKPMPVLSAKTITN